MTKQQVGQKFRAWKKAKDESWKRAWEFADAVAEYAETKRYYSGDLVAETGLTASYIKEVGRTAKHYSSHASRNPQASFRTHMEFMRTGRGGEWVPDDTTLRDVKVPEKSVAKQLAELPPEEAAVVIVEALDTPEIIDAVDENEDAADHVFAATTRLVEKQGKRGRTKKSKPHKAFDEMSLALELVGVLSKLRDLAKEDSDSPLIKSCKDLMRETLEILDGIEEADDPEVVDQMLSDLGDFLATH